MVLELPRLFGHGGPPPPSESATSVRAAFATTSVGMAVLGFDGQFLQANQAFCRITGYSEPELLTTDFRALTHPDDLTQSLAAVRQMLTGQASSIVLDKRYVRRDGSVVWAQTSVTLASGPDGKPTHFVALVQDVSRHKAAEDALLDSERRFRAVFDGALDAMLLVDHQDRYVEANRAACALFGRSRDEILGMPAGGLSAPGLDPASVWRELRQTRRATGRWRIARSDGTTREVEYALTADVLPGLHLNVIRDLAERNAVEAELGREREILKAVVDNIPVMLGIWDPAGRLEWINREWERLRGFSLEEARAPDFLARVYPDPAVREEARRHLRTLGPGWRDFRSVTRDGRILDAAWANARLSDGRTLGIGQDITERKRTEEERERRAAQLQALADAAVTIGATTTIPGITSVVTEAARRIIGAHTSVTSFTVDENWAQAITARSLSERFAAWGDYDARPDGSGIYRLVCHSNRPMRLTRAELEAHPAFRGYGAEKGRHPPLNGWLAVPLVARDGRNLGLIQLSDKYDGDFGEADEAILVQLAHLASEAVENARLLEEVSAGRARLEALSRRLVTLQEEERRAIASGLHDEVGQLLTGLRLMMEDESPDSGKREEKRRVVNEIIGRVRDLSMTLRPPMLDPLGLLPTLLWQIERFEAQTAIQVRFHYANLDRRFDPHVELTAFRVVQEALTNVARHAGVVRVKVEVWADAESLGARIEDEGRGFTVAEALAGPSSGLAGMRERSRLLGGKLLIESGPGSGTRLSLELPLAGTGASAP
jgi:PAS domain S-box-containing protein